MPRNLLLLLSFVFLALLGAITISCGSSGAGGGNGGPYNVVGNWRANFSANVGATATGNGAINSSGVAAFFDGSGNIVQLPTVTGESFF